MDYSSMVSIGLNFRTWELLYDKEVSRVVDEALTTPHLAANDEVVKRLVRSFLPRFPDECRLENELEVLDANWYSREPDEENEETTHRLWIHSCPGIKGDSLWVTYHPDGGFVSEYISDGSSGTGIARVLLLSKPEAGAKIPVKLREVIPFDRFFEYFDIEPYDCDNLEARRFDDYLEESDSSKVKLWRRRDEGVFAIDVYAAQGDYYRTERVYRQLDGTWVHGYHLANWYYEKNLPWVGMSFMSEEYVESIIDTFAKYDNYIEER